MSTCNICDNCGNEAYDLSKCEYCGLSVCSDCLPKHEDCEKEEDNDEGEDWDEEEDDDWDLDGEFDDY